MPVFDPDAALDRLVTIAQSDTGQSARVANFLLAWWNAGDCGGFDITDLWNVDRAIAYDILAVTAMIAFRHEYPTAHGYGPPCERMVADWRPRLFDQPKGGRAWPTAPERGTMPPPLPFADACSGAPLGGAPGLPRGCGEGAGH